MVCLIDANVIIRFLIGDHEIHLQKSKEIFQKIEIGETEVLILESVLMETFFVMTKFYKLPKNEVVDDLKRIIALQGVVNSDKIIFYETLSLVEKNNIDFVNALICTKHKFQDYGKLSFDEDVKKCS